MNKTIFFEIEKRTGYHLPQNNKIGNSFLPKNQPVVFRVFPVSTSSLNHNFLVSTSFNQGELGDNKLSTGPVDFTPYTIYCLLSLSFLGSLLSPIHTQGWSNKKATGLDITTFSFITPIFPCKNNYFLVSPDAQQGGINKFGDKIIDSFLFRDLLIQYFCCERTWGILHKIINPFASPIILFHLCVQISPLSFEFGFRELN